MLLCRLQTLEMHFPVADSDALACHLNLPRCTCSLDLCSLVNSILYAENVSVFNRTHLNYETILKPSDRRQIRQNLHFFGQQLACNIFFSVLPPLSTVLFSGLASPAAVVNKLQMCFGHPVDFHSSCRGEKTEE